MQNKNKHRRRYLEIMEELEASIRSRKYPRGVRLPSEQQLAEQFQVSRPTIREATLALEVRGLVEARIGSGVYVCAETAESSIDILQNESVSPFEILEARELIEGEAVLLAAANANRSDLLRLKQNLQTQRNILTEQGHVRHSEEFLRQDEDFHTQIALMTQNLAIYQVIRSLWEMRKKSPLWQRLNEHFDSSSILDFQDAAAEHEAIYQALEQRNGPLAKQQMATHFAITHKNLMELAGVENL